MNNKLNIPEYYVSEFNKSISDVIESNFNYVKIRGEISEMKKATKGQIYLTLKDDKSILSAVIWFTKIKNLKFKPEIGVEVTATGKITTWSRFKTTYQIDIDNLEIAGQGALLKLIEERKTRLKSKGIFDDKHKKNIPYLPSKIGIISSPTGSVVHDILNRLKLRFPVDVDLWPASVQGSEASISIIKALKGFNSDSFSHKPDVIIVARGGGSTEDLMAFNDEELALEVFKSEIPVISAIGHETDTTIIDYVSDIRASTPTAAAEIAVPLKRELEKNILVKSDQLFFLMKNWLSASKEQLFNIDRMLKSPNYILKNYKEKYQLIINIFFKSMSNITKKKYNKIEYLNKIFKLPDHYAKLKKDEFNKLNFSLEKIINNNIKYKKGIYDNLIKLLKSNALNTNLKKGYVLLSKSNKILKKSSQLNDKDSINIRFIDKSVNVNLKKIN